MLLVSFLDYFCCLVVSRVQLIVFIYKYFLQSDIRVTSCLYCTVHLSVLFVTNLFGCFVDCSIVVLHDWGIKDLVLPIVYYSVYYFLLVTLLLPSFAIDMCHVLTQWHIGFTLQILYFILNLSELFLCLCCGVCRQSIVVISRVHFGLPIRKMHN